MRCFVFRSCAFVWASLCHEDTGLPWLGFLYYKYKLMLLLIDIWKIVYFFSRKTKICRHGNSQNLVSGRFINIWKLYQRPVASRDSSWYSSSFGKQRNSGISLQLLLFALFLSSSSFMFSPVKNVFPYTFSGFFLTVLSRDCKWLFWL